MRCFTFNDFQLRQISYDMVVGMEWAQKQIDGLDSSKWLDWSSVRINKENLLAQDEESLRNFFELSRCKSSFDDFIDKVVSLITAFYYLNGGRNYDYRESIVSSLLITDPQEDSSEEIQ